MPKGGGNNDKADDGDDQLARCKLWWGGGGMSQVFQVFENSMQLDDRNLWIDPWEGRAVTYLSFITFDE